MSSMSLNSMFKMCWIGRCLPLDWGEIEVNASNLLEYYHNTVTPPVNEHGVRYEVAKCHCRCWFCPDCCVLMGYNLRNRLIPALETFNGLMMVTLTIDPELFPDPKTAYLYTMDNRCISVTTQNLDRWNHLHSRRYFYVVEWQEHTEQAHYHVLYDASFILKTDLDKAWSKHRPKNAGPIQENRPAFGMTRFSKRAFEGGVKGGVKVRRVAVQNRGTQTVLTPSDTGCQSTVFHFFNSASGPSTV